MTDNHQSNEEPQKGPQPADRNLSGLPRRRTTDNLGHSQYHPSQPLVHPTIYRYTCRGKLSLSNQQDELMHSAGHCRGVATQLELVDKWRAVTRDEAVQVFAQQVAIHSSAPSASAAAASSAVTPQSANSGASSSTSSAQAMQTALESPVLVYPAPSNGDKEEDDKSKDEKLAVPPPQTKIQKRASSPSGSLDSPSILFTAQDWTCYGTTEVDLLVLRDAKDGDDDDEEEDLQEDTVAAVAPYTSPGVNIRDVQHSDWNSAMLRDRTTTLRVAFLEVIYQQAMEEIEEDEKTDVKSDKKKSIPDKALIDGFATRFASSAGRIVQHMQFNAKLLKDSVQEDFVGRTFAASHRIIDQFDGTWENMNKFASKIVEQTTSWWDDDDDNNNNRKGGPRKGGGGGGGLI